MTDTDPGMVLCAKLGRLAPRLEKPPFPGPLGQRIFENISAPGYDLWKPQMTILINHYALNPADPETRVMLRQQMEEFFFGEDAQVNEDWQTPEQKGPAQQQKK